MKVKDLIRHLEELDPEMPVVETNVWTTKWGDREPGHGFIDYDFFDMEVRKVSLNPPKEVSEGRWYGPSPKYGYGNDIEVLDIGERN